MTKTLAVIALALAAASARAQEPAPQADGPFAVRAGATAGQVQLTVFCDIEEEACQRLVVVLGRLVEAYPAQVGVTFRHRAADGHEQSPRAYRAALAAARQNRGWELLEMACTNPDRLDDAGLRSMAAQLQLDAATFEADALADDLAGVLADDAREAVALGISAVPALLVNGERRSGALTFDAIENAVKAVIK